MEDDFNTGITEFVAQLPDPKTGDMFKHESSKRNGWKFWELETLLREFFIDESAREEEMFKIAAFIESDRHDYSFQSCGANIFLKKVEFA